MGLIARLVTLSLVAVGARVAGMAAAAGVQPADSDNGNRAIVVVVTVAVKPEEVARFERASHQSIACARLEPGNVTFSISKVIATGAPPTFVVYQVWRYASALRHHFHRAYMQVIYEVDEGALIAPPAMSIAAELDAVPDAPTRKAGGAAAPGCD